MITNDFENIKKIKQLRENGNIGWAKHLIPICQNYFDEHLPLSFIKVKIHELYDLDVSIHTLKFIRKKYRKSLVEELSQPGLTTKKTVTYLPKTEVKPIAPNHRKLSPQEREEKDKLLEMAIKNMADFDNRPTERRTELDDLIERQQQQKKLNNQ